MNKLSLMLLIFFSISTIAQATYIDKKNVTEKKRTQSGLYIDAKNAFELLKNEAGKSLFIDVRTRAEIAFGGMPKIADANVPFKSLHKKYKWDAKKDNFKMTLNPDFVSGVFSRLKQKGLTKSDKVFVMCRSGGRSAKAADALTAAGFTQVISIIDGFDGDKAKTGADKGKRVVNGWKNSHLPWLESLDKNKMFLVGDSKKKGKKQDKMLQMIEKMDLDKDGIVTQEEFEKHHKKMFSKFDKDNNNSIDMSEIKAFKKNKKQEKKNKQR